MEEPELPNKKEIIEKLKPFWKRYWELELEFCNKEQKLQEEMNKKLGLIIELEFFYCDGECCGIGAMDFSDRKKFPLIHDSELN
jgi:hypothetical protein